MLNKIWAFFIVISILFAIPGNNLDKITSCIFLSGDNAIKLCIELLPGMCFFCGLLRVAKACGIIERLAFLVKPLVSKLFPDIPSGNLSIPLMITNIFSNIFGAGNAATAMGINAMKELDKLNPTKERASDAMCMFIILNTCTITLFPTGIIALRHAYGSYNPAAIITDTMIVSGILFIFGIAMCKFFARKWR